MINDSIKDVLYDCIILTGGADCDYVYNASAPKEIEKILNDAHVAYNVFTYSIGGEAHDMPDMWCAASWIEAGQMHTVGFNYMTEDRERKLAVFNEVMNNPYHGYYGKH